MKHLAAFTLLSLSTALAAAQQTERFTGDVGGMVMGSSALVRGAEASTSALPYVYGDWGRFYARVDTLGLRALPLGQGHLELAARVSTEGFEGRKTAYPALGDRSSPLPVGMGTFQRTALGGVFAYLMHDARSGGQFAELNWAAQTRLGPVTLYPQLGLQYRSSAYVAHLYGVSAAESAATGLARWQPGASWAPMATLQASLPLSSNWSVQAVLRQRWFDGAVADSPLVKTRSQSSGLLAITRTLN